LIGCRGNMRRPRLWMMTRAEKMDEWNRDYHKVRLPCFFLRRWTRCADQCWTCKANSRYLTTTHRI
jgi:hypothetical protein